MKIGIIGAGNIGRLYASLWLKAGHEVFLSSRNPDDHRAFVEQLGKGAHLGIPAEAAAFGDVVLLAANYQTLDSALEAIGPYVRNKLVIDATNALRWNEEGGLSALLEPGEISAQVLAAKLPQARIAKAFTTLWTGHVEAKGDVENPWLAMPFAVDGQADPQVVAGLIRDAGLLPVAIGGLEDSKPLDPGSPIWNVVLTGEEVLARIQDFRATLAA